MRPPLSLTNAVSIGAEFPAVAIAAVLVAAIALVLHLSARRRWLRRVADLEAQLAAARAKLERAALTMQSDRQIVISWDQAELRADR